MIEWVVVRGGWRWPLWPGRTLGTLTTRGGILTTCTLFMLLKVPFGSVCKYYTVNKIYVLHNSY